MRYRLLGPLEVQADDGTVVAIPALKDVIREAVELDYLVPMAEALDGLAKVNETSDPATGARLIGMADRVRAEARTQVWDRGARGRTVAALRADLGDTTFVELQREGRKCTLRAIAEAALAGDAAARLV